jgi:hypothetical protein
MAGTVTAKAGHNWDKLESIFEQRTAKAMAKLGVPTSRTSRRWPASNRRRGPAGQVESAARGPQGRPGCQAAAPAPKHRPQGPAKRAA